MADTNRFFVIGVLLSAKPNDLKRIFKDVRGNFLGKEKHSLSEIKFSRSSPRIIRAVLKKLTKLKVKIYVWSIDKENRRVADTPENYGLVLQHVLKHGFRLDNWPSVVIDAKFSRAADQAELITVLKSSLGKNINDVSFGDSKLVAGLGLADFVAGVYFAAYNNTGRSGLTKNLESYVVMEERLQWRELKQKATAP